MTRATALTLLIAAEAAWSSLFASQAIAYRQHDWTATSKPAAVAALRRLFADGRIALPPHEPLRRELLSFEERINPSGALTFGARGTGHDDFVSLLVTACMADIGRELVVPATPRLEAPEALPLALALFGRPAANAFEREIVASELAEEHGYDQRDPRHRNANRPWQSSQGS